MARNTNLKKLAGIIHTQGEDLMRLWRKKLRELPAARKLNVAELDDHIRILLDEIAKALETEESKSMLKIQVDGGSSIHGAQRVRQRFNLTEVVAEYNALREVIQEFGE